MVVLIDEIKISGRFEFPGNVLPVGRRVASMVSEKRFPYQKAIPSTASDEGKYRMKNYVVGSRITVHGSHMSD